MFVCFVVVKGLFCALSLELAADSMSTSLVSLRAAVSVGVVMRVGSPLELVAHKESDFLLLRRFPGHLVCFFVVIMFTETWLAVGRW